MDKNKRGREREMPLRMVAVLFLTVKIQIYHKCDLGSTTAIIRGSKRVGETKHIVQYI